MRYSKEHKQETHTRIVKKAAVLLREKARTASALPT